MFNPNTPRIVMYASIASLSGCEIVMVKLCITSSTLPEQPDAVICTGSSLICDTYDISKGIGYNCIYGHTISFHCPSSSLFEGSPQNQLVKSQLNLPVRGRKMGIDGSETHEMKRLQLPVKSQLYIADGCRVNALP